MEFLLFSFNKTAVDYAKKENHQKVVALLSKNIIEQNQAILKNFEKSKTETEKLRDENNSLLKRIKELEEENKILKEKLQVSEGEKSKQKDIISELTQKLTS